MRDDGMLDESEKATMREAVAIINRWLEAHKDEKGGNPGYWGIEEAGVQLRLNLCFMVDDMGFMFEA